MSGEYVGALQSDDPLNAFLAHDIMASTLGVESSYPVFDVYRLDGSGTVYRYVERQTSLNVIGKFYGNKWLDGSQAGAWEQRAGLLQREYANLLRARSLGLDAPPYRVVRPLAAAEAINCVLIEEFVAGADLGFFIREAIFRHRARQLRARLVDTARFLAELHHRSCTAIPIMPAESLAYLDKLISQLADWHVIDSNQQAQLAGLGDQWNCSGRLGGAPQVLIHGDATPPHFLFGGTHDVTVIDLERLRQGDPATDLGCLAAELKHLFFWYTGDPWASEQFIQQLYASYIQALAYTPEEQAQLTTRGRFFMSCYLLRISRNSWLDLFYRQRLVDVASGCLAAPPM